MADVCERCGGSEWVCENHRDKSWPDECQCGAGDPCPDCNPLANDHGPDDRFYEGGTPLALDEAWDALFSVGSALRKLDG